jgi:hypothetical protein
LRLSEDYPIALTVVSLVSPSPATGSMFPNFFPSYTNGALPSSQAAVSDVLFSSSSSSRYDSLQGGFQTHARHVHIGSAFTWSHARDDSSDFFDTASSFALPQDPLHPSERGSSDFDIRLRSVTHFVVGSPLHNRFARDWELAGIVTIQTGQPFTVNTSYDVNQDGILTDRIISGGLTGPGLGQAPEADSRVQLAFKSGVWPKDLLSPSSATVADQFGYCVQPSGSAIVNLCDGTVGRNTFRAAGQHNFDLALSRSIALSETVRVVFRTEAFNAFNRVNFSIPVRILESPAFGKAVSTASPNRILQFAMKVTF